MPPKKRTLLGRYTANALACRKRRALEASKQTHSPLSKISACQVVAPTHESAEENSHHLAIHASYTASLLSTLTEEQHCPQNFRAQLFHSLSRTSETLEKRRHRQNISASTTTAVRQRETPAQTSAWRLKNAAATAATRDRESPAQHSTRHCRNPAATAAAISNNKKNEIQHLGEEHKNKKLKSQQSDDKCQMDSASSSQKTSKMPVQQDSSSAQASQSMIKPLKQKFLVPNHQHCIMSNLVSMWKSRKFCDVSISNGSFTLLVHKILLSAVSPKLFAVFSTYVSSQFYEVKFPEVSTEALMAFVEYIYTGLLDLDLNVLQEIKVIAKKLDMKDLQNLCDVHLLSGARQQLASTVTAFDDPKQIPSYVSAITTEDIKQEISQNELPELKEDTDRIFEQQIEGTSMDTKDGNSPAGSLILPSVKIESVGPDDDKYGQMNIRTYTSSSVSDTSQALNTTLNPIAVSTTDFSLPFTDTTNNNTTANKIHGTSPKLKSDVSEGSLVSDLTSLSYSDEKLCSQSRLNKEEPSEPLNQTITTQSIDNNVTFGSNEGVYPVGLFTAGGDRLPLSSTQITSVKNIGLYKIDGFT